MSACPVRNPNMKRTIVNIPIAKIVSINAEAPRPKLDIERIRRLRESLPKTDFDTVRAIREMRAGRYGEVEE